MRRERQASPSRAASKTIKNDDATALKPSVRVQTAHHYLLLALPLAPALTYRAVGPTAAATPVTLRRGLEDGLQTRHQMHNAMHGSGRQMMPRVRNPRTWQQGAKTPAGHQVVAGSVALLHVSIAADVAEGHTELSLNVISTSGNSGPVDQRFDV